jgi:hypothetical protein
MFCKGSANRAKNQRKTSFSLFFRVQPTFGAVKGNQKKEKMPLKEEKNCFR